MIPIPIQALLDAQDRAEARARLGGKRLTTLRAPNCCCDRMAPETLQRYGQCALCYIFQTQPEYFAKWSGQPQEPPDSRKRTIKVIRCPFLGDVVRNQDGKPKTRHCPSCANFPNKVVRLCTHPMYGPQHEGEVIVTDCAACPYPGKFGTKEIAAT